MCTLRSGPACLDLTRERFNMCVVNFQIRLQGKEYCIEAWYGEKPLVKDCVSFGGGRKASSVFHPA